MSDAVEGAPSVFVHIDGSTDGTEDALREHARCLGDRLHLSMAPTNTGYGRALLALLRSASSRVDAVVLCADDDLPMPSGLPAVKSALVEYAADMVSTPVPRSGHEGLDRSLPRTRRATAPELRAVAAHAPGIVFRTSALGDPLDLLERRLDLGCAFARAYPQAVIAAALLAHGRVWWLDVPVVMTGTELPTGIRGASGGTYSSPRERWEQWWSFQALLDGEIAASSGRARARLRAIRSAEDVQLLPHLRAGLCGTPAAEAAFDRAANRTYRDGGARRVIRWLRSLGREPDRSYLLARMLDTVKGIRVRRS